MYCLYCGDCCLRMSPISAPNPCPNITQIDNYYFCNSYKQRPKECVKHSYDWEFACPIGMEKLKLSSHDEIRNRVDSGWELIQRRVK